MNSIQERATVLPRISIEYTDEFIIEVKHEGKVVGEVLIQLSSLEYSLMGDKKADIGIFATNVNPLNRDNTTIGIEI